MPEITSSPCDSIAREVNELIERKKDVRKALSKAPPSKKPSLEKRMEKVTSELEHKRQQLRKCLKQNPPLPPSDPYIVKEVHQKPITNDPFVNGNIRDNWTLKVPANMPQWPPVGPTEEEFDLLAKNSHFAPAVEARLTPGATRQVEVQIEAPSMLLGSVRWIGTRSPLDVNLLLDGVRLVSGTSHGYLQDRGATSLHVRTTKGGLARLSVTNTSGTTVKVKIVLAAFDLIHEMR